MSQREVIEFLSDPRSYGNEVEAVERRETHGAIVFLAGDRAYKLKRAVRFPYMDYSTATLRRRMCEEELAINRVAARELYLEVRAIARKPDGSLSFADPQQDAIDWVVAMRRFDESQLLEQMRRRGALDAPLVRSLATVIAHLHKQADLHPEKGGFAGIAAVIDENAQIFGELGDRFLKADDVNALNMQSRAAVRRLRYALEYRRAHSFVRRCHGDLHLNNICLVDGRPVLFDAIEFSDDFSCIDVYYDLAFLLMDVDRHGLGQLSNVLLNAYVDETGDYGGLQTLPLFLSCRAAIRAHVAVARGLESEAGDLLARALRYLSPLPPRLVAIGGMSGSGKSTLAKALAPALGAAPGAIVLRSDVIRKRLLGVQEFERLPEPAYAPDITLRVYASLMDDARRILESGHSVIADAVFGREDERTWIASTARKLGIQFDGLWLEADTNVMEERIADRGKDASDATLAVLRRQITQVSAPSSWTVVRTGGSVEQSCGEAMKVLGVRPIAHAGANRQASPAGK